MAYITGGDPTPEKTVDIALALSEAGIDFLEIGIPFSDPLADGVANQLGAQRALTAGTTVPKLLRTIGEQESRRGPYRMTITETRPQSPLLPSVQILFAAFC